MSFAQDLFRSVDGTLLNAGTVLIGGVAGTLLGNRLPARIHDTLFAAIGLVTLLIGIAGALTTRNTLVLLGGMLLGGLVGELLRIDQRLTSLGDWLQRRLSRSGSTFSEAFVTSSLVFCVGPLTILGALNNGLNGDITDLAIKATLDGFAALAFAATLGWGVMVSVLTILIYQGAISLGANGIQPVLSGNPGALTELNAAGGLILLALGLKLLKIRDLPVANFLPALAIAPLLAVLATAVGHWQHLIR